MCVPMAVPSMMKGIVPSAMLSAVPSVQMITAKCVRTVWMHLSWRMEYASAQEQGRR